MKINVFELELRSFKIFRWFLVWSSADRLYDYPEVVI